uniref:Uncharacterized protein n=1 Tax=Knipowitschia caucasica TaxID=637954 RepID=A0AAV2KC36_KNICA
MGEERGAIGEMGEERADGGERSEKREERKDGREEELEERERRSGVMGEEKRRGRMVEWREALEEVSGEGEVCSLLPLSPSIITITTFIQVMFDVQE